MSHPTDAFHAGRIVAEVIDGCWFVGFADQDFGTVRYLSLSRTQQESEEDARLGIDTYYVERDDQRHSCYGGIASALLEPERFSISFTEQGSGYVSLSQLIVTFGSPSTPPNFEVYLGHVFSGTRCLVISAHGP